MGRAFRLKQRRPSENAVSISIIIDIEISVHLALVVNEDHIPGAHARRLIVVLDRRGPLFDVDHLEIAGHRALRKVLLALLQAGPAARGDANAT